MTNSRIKILKQYLWLALFVVLVRVLFRVFFGDLSGSAFWAALEGGARLAFWVIGFGVLNAFIDFKKVFRRTPKIFRTPLTALNIAFALMPEVSRSIERVRYAAKLRAHRKGLRWVQSVVVPVVSNGIDQALNLGESMEARGFGKAETSSTETPSLLLDNVSFGFEGRSNLLHNLTLKVVPGELTLITGNTGSGKSTLLKLIQAKNPGSAYVNQFPREGFLAETVFDELAFSLLQKRLPTAEVNARVTRTSERFDLGSYLKADPQTLSAGWQQRLAIAAALISDSKLLLLDEPFSALDGHGVAKLNELLNELKENGLAIVVVEHRTELLQKLANHTFVLDFGRLSMGLPKVQKLTSLPQKSATVILGDNGSGKTTFLRTIATTRGVLVPQPASDLLFLNTVLEELRQSDQDAKVKPGTTAELFTKFVNVDLENQNPRDLSQGQKLALAISIQLAKATELLMLDEPTLGFDLPSRQTLANLIGTITESGTRVLVATHDLEFANAISKDIRALETVSVTDV